MNRLIEIRYQELRELVRAYCNEESDFINKIKEMLGDVDEFKREFSNIKALREKEILDRVVKVFRLSQTSRFHKRKINAKKLAEVIEEIMKTPPEKLMERIDNKLGEWTRNLEGIGIDTLTRILAGIHPTHFAPWNKEAAKEYLTFLGFEEPRTYSEFLRDLGILKRIIHGYLNTDCGQVEERYINFVVDHFGWWLGKNKNLITLTLKKRVVRAVKVLKAEHSKEWVEKKDEIMETIKKLRDTIESCAQGRIENCVKTINDYGKRLRDLYSARGFVVWPFGSVRTTGKEILAVIRNEHLMKVIERIKELKNEKKDPLKDETLWKLISELIKRKEKNLRLRNITSYLFIFDPATFYPVVDGSFNKDLAKYLGIKLKKDKGRGRKGVEIDYKTFLKVLHEAAKEEGISGMAELVSYLAHFSLDKLNEVRQMSEGYDTSSSQDDVAECGEGFLKTMIEIINDILERKGQVILYGPPGTGKTWLAKKYAECKARKTHEFITFHQSYSYEEFIEGIWPETEEDAGTHTKRFIFVEVTSAPPPEPGNTTHIGKILWGPGPPYQQLGYLTDIRKGDIILHYMSEKIMSENEEKREKYKKAFVGYSIAVSDPIRIDGKETMKKYLKKRLGKGGNGSLSKEYTNFMNKWVEDKKYETFYVVELSDFVLFKNPVKFDMIKDPLIRQRLGIAGCSYYIRIVPFEVLKHIAKIAGASIITPKYGDTEKSRHNSGGIRYVLRDGILKRIAILATCDLLKNIDPDALGDLASLVKMLKHSDGSYSLCKSVYASFLREMKTKKIPGLRDALKEAAKRSRKYILVIDEINRGDISRILGDLISLLEPDKRLGSENQIIATLPYSQEPFAIPPNLYIIGTMNTADRSIALVDIALRRRFAFLEIPPDPTIIEKEVEASDELAKKIAALLMELNKQIERRLGRDHRIGHSYFLKVRDLKDLGRVWVHEIMPLLIEYFYNRWGDLKEVLSEVLGDTADKFFKKLGEEYYLVDLYELYEVKNNIDELYQHMGKELIQSLEAVVAVQGLSSQRSAEN